MQLWRYVLTFDDHLDLADFASVREFSHRVFGALLVTQSGHGPNDVPVPGIFGPPLIKLGNYELDSDAEREAWAQAVFAFRSVAKRVMGAKPKRKASITPVKADAVLCEHISYLSPRIVGDGKPLKSVPRLIHLPMNKDGTRNPIPTFEDAVGQFWQSVFGSMLIESFSGVCGECGKELGTTKKTGKPRRGEFCRACKDKLRLREMPDEKRKKLKREKMARYRANLKQQRAQREDSQA